MSSVSGGFEQHSPQRIVRSAHLMATTVEMDTVLLDAEAGKYYGFDAIGSDIWRRLEQPVSVSALCAALCADYAGEADVIGKDVCALLDSMLQSGLIDICPA